MGIDIFAFAIVLGVLIFFHELGHFVVARLCGVGVEKFSLGFGPRLIGKKIGITDYRISAIPLGGFVKMVGDEPDSEVAADDVHLSFNHKSVFKRILIVAAGPVFNLFLAVLIFFGFFLAIGIEDIKPVVNKIEAEGPAIAAGMQTGDVIVSIDNSSVESWYDVDKAITKSKGRRLAILVERRGSTYEFMVAPQIKKGKDLLGDETEYYDLGISGLREIKAVIGDVSEGFPAQKAGLKKGDRIIAINGQKVDYWKTMREIIASSKGERLEITVRRGETTLTVSLVPRLEKQKNALGEEVNRYLIGILTEGIPKEDRITKRLTLPQAFVESVNRTYFVSEFAVRGIVKMIQGSVSKDNLGGPIMIAHMAGDQARAGIDKLIQLIAFISINLAILNLLPIPVLDGGHLLFFCIEAVKGSPVSIKVRELAQQAGVIALILLMVFVFYNDITRYFLR